MQKLESCSSQDQQTMFSSSSSGSEPLSVSKSDILRGIITEKMNTAAREILAVVERTVTDYEAEASGFRQEIDRQRRQLELLLPQLKRIKRDEEEAESRGLLPWTNNEEEEDVKPTTIFRQRQEALKDPDYDVPSRMRLLRVLFSGEQKYVRLSNLTLDNFLKEVCLKFNIPGDRRLGLKVFDQSDTQIDAEVFEEVVKESHGTLQVIMTNGELGPSLSSLESASSDDAALLNFMMCDPAEDEATAGGSQPKKSCHINYEAQALIERILTTRPGGERIMNEYAKTRSLSDATRRRMINILAAEMTEQHGMSPPRSVRVMYAQGIVALFPYLEDPLSKHGYEHYYDPERGSGYLAWRLKTLQRKAAEDKGGPVIKSPKFGGPGHARPRLLSADRTPPGEDVEAAIAVMKHCTDEDTVRRKMKATFVYRNSMVNGDKTTADVLSVFPRFLDTPGLIEQDFRLLFDEDTANRFLERWPGSIKAKVIEESRRLVPTQELLDLLHNAESAAEVEHGWDRDMSSILLLLHLLPPSAQGRKRPGKMSASQAVDHLVRFLKAGTSVQQHLDNSSQSQPYLLAQGPSRSSIRTFFVVMDKYALPCKAAGSVGALDELFKAHYVFGTSYSCCLTSFFTFLQTTVYNIDVGQTKETPRVAELRARMLR